MSVTDDLAMEDYLSWEGVDYRTSSGSSGTQLHIRECPECGNDKWKVYLNAETGLGNCFACGIGYNKWKFIGKHKALEKRELFDHIVQVKKDLGFTPVVRKPAVALEIDTSDLDLPDSLALPTADGQNAAYLVDRGVSNADTAYFQFRYCHDAWHRYTKPDGTQGGQNFGKRILIPIFDLDGNLKTFQGRDVSGESDTRYMFPAQLPASGRYLYNGHRALASRASEVIVNEGVFSVAATKRVIDAHPEMFGIVPLGTFGKHLSANEDGAEDQLSAFAKLKRHGLRTVTIMWDGEREALNAALTAGEILMRKLGLEVRIALLPAGKDPDEATPHEVYEAWLNALTLSPLVITKLRLRNPYPEKVKPLVDEELGI